MEFERESEMVPLLVEWLESKNLRVRSEVGTPWGICDLVGVRVNKQEIRERAKLSQMKSPKGPMAFAMLHLIPDVTTGKMITAKGISSKFYSPIAEEQIRIVIEDLKAKNLVHEVKKSHFVRTGNWIGKDKKMVAVELKLTRVFDAIHQARTNRGLTSESYIAMPTSRVDIMKKRTISAIRGAGIGLIAVGKNDVRTVIRPERTTTDILPPLQAYVAESFTLGILRDNSS